VDRTVERDRPYFSRRFGAHSLSAPAIPSTRTGRSAARLARLSESTTKPERNLPMKFSSKIFSCVLAAAAISLAVCAATPASAQTGPTLLQERTSADGLLTLSLWSANGSDTVGVNDTYTWIATNNSATSTLTEVILGSHWGD